MSDDKNVDKEVQLVIRVPKHLRDNFIGSCKNMDTTASREVRRFMADYIKKNGQKSCLLYTSPSPRDRTRYRMPSSA